MRKTKKMVAIITFSLTIASFIGCSRSETGSEEADNALKAFNAIVKEYPDNKGFHEALQHWGFLLPTGEKFEWSRDMSANKADFAIVMLADPLVEAGLDISKLDENEWLYEPAGKDEMGVELPNRLILPYNVSDEKQESSGSEDSMRRLLKAYKDNIKYNEDEKHYALELGDNNEVQWTEKLGLNDEDMVFILNSEPLVKAGLDVTKLEGSGWEFKAAGEDDKGTGANTDQIVKIFDIKK